MKQYTIYFSGQAIEGFSIAQVKQNLAKIFKLDNTKIARLFTNKPVIIKKNLSAEQAKKYQTALLKAGAKIQIKQAEITKDNLSPTEKKEPSAVSQPIPATTNSKTNDLSAGLAGLMNYNQHAQANSSTEKSSEQTSTEQPSSKKLNQAIEAPTETNADIPPKTPETSEGISVAPANTGSLEEFMIKSDDFEEPDLSEYSMSEANTGSLEEYAAKVVPIELPDIAYMDITDKNNRPLSDQSPKPKTVPLPDIDNLTMAEAESGDLTEFNEEKEAVELPDIDNISMAEAENGDLRKFEMKKEPIPLPDISQLELED